MGGGTQDPPSHKITVFIAVVKINDDNVEAIIKQNTVVLRVTNESKCQSVVHQELNKTLIHLQSKPKEQ